MALDGPKSGQEEQALALHSSRTCRWLRLSLNEAAPPEGLSYESWASGPSS